MNNNETNTIILTFTKTCGLQISGYDKEISKNDK